MSEEYSTEHKMSPRERIENYWYHYKWHTLIALFIILVVTVCTLQLCQRSSYDVYVMYAGSASVDRTSKDGDIPEYQKALSSLTKYADDYDENGEVAVNLLALFTPTNSQIEDMVASGANVSYNVVYDNTNILSDNMINSSYYLCFLSEELFLKYCEEESRVFDEIEGYADSAAEYEYVNEYGIKLSSLSIYRRDGIKNLPDDTVVCIRRLSPVATRFDRAAEKLHERAGMLLRELLDK